METVDLSYATKSFPAAVRAGEYVIWWVSDDRQNSIQLSGGSVPADDLAPALDYAENYMNEELDGSGELNVYLVVEDDIDD